MSKPITPTGPNGEDTGSLRPDPEDFEAIESAVMETARGRWFLAEFARRTRAGDTIKILDAISSLEGRISLSRDQARLDAFGAALSEMRAVIDETKVEISTDLNGVIATDDQPNAHGQGNLEAASTALDNIVKTTEQATSQILESAEKIQEMAWTLREDGANEEICAVLDQHATGIYTACSFQDLTGQRTEKVIHTLRFLDARLHALIDLWQAPADGNTVDMPAPAPPVSPEPEAALPFASEDALDRAFNGDEDLPEEDFAEAEILQATGTDGPVIAAPAMAEPADTDDQTAPTMELTQATPDIALPDMTPPDMGVFEAIPTFAPAEPDAFADGTPGVDTFVPEPSNGETHDLEMEDAAPEDPTPDIDVTTDKVETAKTAWPDTVADSHAIMAFEEKVAAMRALNDEPIYAPALIPDAPAYKPRPSQLTAEELDAMTRARQVAFFS